MLLANISAPAKLRLSAVCKSTDTVVFLFLRQKADRLGIVANWL